MAIVIGIKFRTGQKVYYFDPAGEEFKEGDSAILETARGIEYGKVAFGNREVDDKEVVPPLKPVIRKATPKDDEQHRRNIADRERLMDGAIKRVAAHELPMKIVDAEYTFDRSKVIIYFTAENRIDFRELVKDLAALFRVRIELRQIYERDDIKLRGALASCGRPCCCITHLQNYDKVSIKMAKVQGLSLNPGKISGCCGKLMCCLRYENDYYQDTFKKMPKINSTVTTPEGEGTATAHNMLKQTVRVRLNKGDGSTEIKDFPLEELRFRKAQQGGGKKEEEAEE